jgi:hypothetical protein
VLCLDSSLYGSVYVWYSGSVHVSPLCSGLRRQKMLLHVSLLCSGSLSRKNEEERFKEERFNRTNVCAICMPHLEHAHISGSLLRDIFPRAPSVTPSVFKGA